MATTHSPRRARPAPPPGRPGLTLVEVLVAVAVTVVLAAAFVPGLLGSLNRSRVDGTAESLMGIAEAAGSMWRDVGAYPGRLTHLTEPIAAGDLDVCGTAYGAGAAAAWAGPYLDRSVSTAGLPLPVGRVEDAFGYAASPPVLIMVLDSVSHADLRTMNRDVDADADSAGGAVQWGPVSGSGMAEGYYVRPVPPC